MGHIYRLPRWLSGKESACWCGRLRSNPWVGTIPWRRAWQCTPVFSPEKSCGQRSPAGYSPWGHRRVGQTWAWVHSIRGHWPLTLGEVNYNPQHFLKAYCVSGLFHFSFSCPGALCPLYIHLTNTTFEEYACKSDRQSTVFSVLLPKYSSPVPHFFRVLLLAEG